jgi:potassium channel LctB
MSNSFKRYGQISNRLANMSFWQLTIEFIILYIGIAIVFAYMYWIFGKIIPYNYFSFNKGNLCFLQSLYFSFITQLTIGYGDYTPLFLAQPLSIIQGIIGVVIVGVWAGIFVAKWFTAGDRKSIFFSDWAGYSLEEERFFILYVNRNAGDLVDTNISGVIRLERYDPAPPHINPAYIGKSAWTFAFQKVPIEKLAKMKLDDDDGIKVSISGTAGMTRCTNWRRYRLAEIYVLPNRRYYWQDMFTNPRFDNEFYANFRSPLAEGATPFRLFDFASETERRNSLPKDIQ